MFKVFYKQTNFLVLLKTATFVKRLENMFQQYHCSHKCTVLFGRAKNKYCMTLMPHEENF